jgi:hypothetical protein
MRISNYLGTSFEIWKGRHTWFWFVADTCCSGAVIGAAANEAEAIREARLSIEEMASRRLRTAESLEISNAMVRVARECSPANSTDLGWNDLLTKLECYLTQLRTQCV